MFGSAKESAASDAMLMARVRAGNESAMAELYERYSNIVYGVALRVLGEAGAAEDLLQEVFMQLWRTSASFDASRGSLPAWLAVISRHRAIDQLRKRRPETDIAEISIPFHPDLDGATDRKIMIGKIRGLLNNMPKEQRRLLDMAFFEGLTHAEIAAKTGEPLGTVKTRIRAGLQNLRKALS